MTLKLLLQNDLSIGGRQKGNNNIRVPDTFSVSTRER